MSGTATLDFDTMLPRHFADVRNACKTIERVTGASEHTVKNWLKGRCSPQMRYWVKLLAAFPRLRAEINLAIEAEARACAQLSKQPAS